MICQARRHGVPGQPKNKAQATIELTLGLIVAFLFFGAIIRFFLWANTGIIKSQIDYQDTRVTAIDSIHLLNENDFVMSLGWDNGGHYYPDNPELDLEKPNLVVK